VTQERHLITSPSAPLHLEFEPRGLETFQDLPQPHQRIMFYSPYSTMTEGFSRMLNLTKMVSRSP
jgi:hypothetical protein